MSNNVSLRLLTILRRKYSIANRVIETKPKESNKYPWFISGLTDGDGTFVVLVFRNSRRLGWTVKLEFTICAALNSANYDMLKNIQTYFGGIGHIHAETSDNTYRFTVYKVAECKIIRDHFNQFPLFTYKTVYFKL